MIAGAATGAVNDLCLFWHCPSIRLRDKLSRLLDLLLVALPRGFLCFPVSGHGHDANLSEALALGRAFGIEVAWLARGTVMHFGNDFVRVVALDVLPGTAQLAEHCASIVVVEATEAVYHAGVFHLARLLLRGRVAVGGSGE